MRKRKQARLVEARERKSWMFGGDVTGNASYSERLNRRYKTVEQSTLHVHEQNFTERKTTKRERDAGATGDYQPIAGDKLLAMAEGRAEAYTLVAARKAAIEEAKPAPFESAPAPGYVKPAWLELEEIDAAIAVLDKKLNIRWGDGMAKIVAQWQLKRERLLKRREPLTRLMEPDSEAETIS